MIDALIGALLVAMALGLGLARGPRTFGSRAYRVSLMAWHTAWCLVYWRYAQTAVADVTLYLAFGATGEATFVIGTQFVNSLCVVLVRYLGLSELNTYLVFNLAGAWGLLLLRDSLGEATAGVGSGAAWILRHLVWLPGLSFWSSAPGKDGIAFLGVVAAIRGAMHVQRRWAWIVFGTACLGSVRPHMAGLLILAALLSQLLGQQRNARRLATLWVLVGVATVVVPFALQYVGLGGLGGLGDLTTYVEQRQSLNLSGGSSLDISSMSTPEQLFTFMFRPLFLDAPGITALVVSFENLILLVFGFLTAHAAIRVRGQVGGFALRSCLIYGSTGWLLLALVTANLGIAVRQKTMLLPALFIIGGTVLAAARLQRRPARLSQEALPSAG